MATLPERSGMSSAVHVARGRKKVCLKDDTKSMAQRSARKPIGVLVAIEISCECNHFLEDVNVLTVFHGSCNLMARRGKYNIDPS